MPVSTIQITIRQILFWLILFICFHLAGICLHSVSRTSIALKNRARNPCYKREAKTGKAFDFVALMPRLDDAGEKKRLLVWH
jgi:hypothetical protein